LGRGCWWGQPLCSDEDIPRLDAHCHESLGERPRIVAAAAMDLAFAGRIDDQQRPDAPMFATGERAAEQDETLVCGAIHEHGVIVDPWLLERPLPIDPDGPASRITAK
jgi:hypothetical protein